ncbi:hypothetical protein N431DRAFT_461505 [Stipitochalara longipes BDJ]|nr:hypothetical protein N431DRAFT_461505 [Stipitochalara longipes BDJ]
MSALTTTFTPAPSCTTDLYTVTSGTYYSIGGPSASISQCFPSGWQSLSQYFSPGVCPQGYTQACSDLSGSDVVTETRATCCPLNYNCYTLADTNFPGQACVSIFDAVETTVAIDAVALTTETVTLHPSTEAVNAFGVSIRYKAADFIFSTSSISFSPISTTFGGSSSSSPTSSNFSAPVSTTSRLSIGAKAGIGIGIGLVALLVIVGLVMFFAQKRKRQQQAHYPLQALPGSLTKQGPIRLGGEVKQPQELYVNIPPAELENHELNQR